MSAKLKLSSNNCFRILYVVLVVVTVAIGSPTPLSPQHVISYTLASPAQAASSSSYQSSTLNPYPNKPRITFNKNPSLRKTGTFKLTIFSDLHFGENPWDDWGPEQDRKSVALMRAILEDEKPDFVVLNGDLITGESKDSSIRYLRRLIGAYGKDTFSENSTSLIDQIVAPLNEAHIPFATTLGNHDNQPNITHLQEIERLQLVSPLCYTRASSSFVGGEGGEGNYWVPVYESGTDNHPALILWFFDSRGGRLPGHSQPLPDWVNAEVAQYIESDSSAMSAGWGSQSVSPRGALAFVHIPPHAIEKIQTTLNETSNPGLNADKLGTGSTQGSEYPTTHDNDLPFWNSLNYNVENLHAVISGHAHGNEWCAREPTNDVIFCFSKHSGYGGYNIPGWAHGVRNIFFSSADPTVAPHTWIRLEDGGVRANVTLDDNYGR